MNISQENLIIHRVFEQVVESAKDNIAIKFEDQQLTYEVLNGQANHLATQLINNGCKQGDTVAVILDRSIQMYVSILAILKCGAAYLPLDLSNPEQRNLFCLDMAKVNIIISNHDCHSLAQNRRIIFQADDTNIFGPIQTNNIERDVDANDVCYVMFTSGSTGDPKGVMVRHCGVVRLVKQTNYIAFDEDDNILQFAPLSFDASTFEIWGPLLNGATLVAFPKEGLDPNLLVKTIREHQITTMWLTAALFHLVAVNYIEALGTIRTLLAGGDVLNPRIVNAVLDQYPHMTIINGYGPTENTTFTCCHKMSTDKRPGNCVPIGKAISGTAIHILDANKRPVKPGEIGQLYTSGLGVAKGYMGPRGQENFFYDSEIGLGHIYNTGDLVRENEFGELEFKGRVDNQVKVRGHRVSLEEIQSHLLKLDNIKDVVVTLRNLESGDQQLIAFLQFSTAHNLTPKDVKKHLAFQMPKYMIPDLIHLDKPLPINKNGKIDKKHAVSSLETA